MIRSPSGSRRSHLARLGRIWTGNCGARLFRKRRATAALEFALAAPLLVLMLGGAADFGLALYYRTRLASAVAAGTQYAYNTGTSVTTTNIQTVVQSAMFLSADASSNLSVSFAGASPGVQSPGWYCVTGTGPTVTASAQSSTCSDGTSAGYYISFQATYTNIGLLSGVLAEANRMMAEQVTLRLK
jgi:Flp pilus assembly protein TadG